ncbi:MAG: prepilin peptidase [Symploca sp. SIO2D2]|nr:prepilin peptidase [Symploca sp. SIO2D2]
MEDFKTVNDNFPIVFQIGSFVFGAIIGSFLNVCIYRIPEKRSIITPGSTCACGKPIAWYDNIPILSWFILRGKARCCDLSYSFRYPAVEALTGALFLFAWLSYSPLVAALMMFFIALLICASFIDFDHMEIPDRFSIGTAFFGILLSVFFPQLHGYESSSYYIFDATRGFFDSVLGLMIGSGIILWIAITAEKILKKEAMGFGDVKLMGGIGAFLGWKGAIFSIFGGAVIGTLGIAIALLLQNLIPSLRAKRGEIAFGKQTPFGPMLAAGAIAYALFLKDYVDLYFETVVDTLNRSF